MEGCTNTNASKDKYFNIKTDRFRCIVVKSKDVSFESDDDFRSKLEASIAKWKEEGVRGLWVKVAIQHASLVPICAQLGLDFHHAKSGYVMMKTWLHETEGDTLPDYANQYLGAGGFVINKHNQVLVVKERFSTYHHWKLPGGHALAGAAGFVVNEHNQLLVIKERFAVKKHWKLPGGLADPGEDIGEAAEREVFEETGIKCHFKSLICFRHQHNFRYGCSDLYFICLMEPETSEITKCQNEIAEAQWMDLDDYISNPDISEANHYFAKCYKTLLDKGTGYSIQDRPVLAFTKDRYNKVYSIQPLTGDLDDVVKTEENPGEGTK